MVVGMRTHERTWALILTLTVGAVALGGCGSGQTKTVSVSGSPTPATGTATTHTGPAASATVPSTSATSTSGQGNGEATRTAPAPAFTKQTATGEGLGAALAVVKAHGYTAGDTSDYRPDQTLRVLVGTRTGSADGYGQQAFFFVDDRYIGTDTSEPSAAIKVLSQSDTEVTLAYPLYRAHDPLCCPGAGQATVRFQLNNGRLVALDPIPPASSAGRA